MSVCCANSMDLDWGKEQAKNALQRAQKVNAEELSSSSQSSFDADEAYQQTISGEVITSEVSNFLSHEDVIQNMQDNKRLDPEEGLFIHSDRITDDPFSQLNHIVQEEGVNYSFEKCRKSGDPYPLIVIRSLDVQVDWTPPEITITRVCKRHQETKKFHHKKSAEEEVARRKREFKKNPEIKTYSAEITSGSVWGTYTVEIKWKHIDNASSCRRFREEKEEVSPGVSEEEDRWVYENPDYLLLSQSPDCTLIDHKCLEENETRMINGKEVTRKCWKEKLSFLHKPPEINECEFLRAKNCEEVSQTCLEPSSNGCTLWEKTFKCLFSSHSVVVPVDGDAIDFGDYDMSYEENTSFAEVVSKLAVFSEIEDEMRKSDLDASEITLFKGKKFECSKNVLEGLLYDCCLSMSGLATQVNLTKCSAEELGLAQMREEGFCHYVGSYKETLLGVTTSHHHTFCCFSSKLARVLQEGGRKQLGRGWGDSESPLCGGLSHDEIGNLDFSKMDFSEIYQDQLKQVPNDLEERLDAFQVRLEDIQEKMEQRL